MLHEEWNIVNSKSSDIVFFYITLTSRSMIFENVINLISTIFYIKNQYIMCSHTGKVHYIYGINIFVSTVFVTFKKTQC